MREVRLPGGHIAFVDEADYERAAQFRWHANIRHRRDGSILNIYAQRSIKNGDRCSTESLHRFIIGSTDSGMEVDHADHNGLNCQRSNLRLVDRSKNMANRRLNNDNTSGYKGVAWHKRISKWQAAIRANNQRICLGYFSDPKEAGAAYAAAARKYFGEFACVPV